MSTFCDRCGAAVEAGAQRCDTCGWPVPVPLTSDERGRLAPGVEVDDQPTPVATQRVEPPVATQRVEPPVATHRVEPPAAPQRVEPPVAPQRVEPPVAPARAAADPVRGTGTPLPPMPSAAWTRQVAEATEETPEQTPRQTPEERWGTTSPAAYDAPAAAPYEPLPYEPLPDEPAPYEPEPLPLHGRDDDDGGSPVATRLLLGLAAGAVVVLVGLFVLFYGVLRSPSDPAPTVAGTPSASSTASASGGSSSTQSAPTTSQPTTPSTTTAAYPPVTLSGSACGTQGTGAWANVAAGSASTSCPFALAVQSAYVALRPTPGQAVTLTATSPVTKKPYAMSCSGNQPVRCTGGNGALVFLYGGTATFSG